MTPVDVVCETGHTHDVLAWRDVDLNETSRIRICRTIAAITLGRWRGGCRRGVQLGAVESEERCYVVRRGHECARTADTGGLCNYDIYRYRRLSIDSE